MSVPENLIEENPAARPIPKALSNAAARLVDSLKINSVSEKMQRGHPVIIKRRNGYSEPLAELANVYFRMAGIPIRFWAKTDEWREWEVKCFNLLNGDGFRARASGANSVRADKLPGTSFWNHLTAGTITRAMTEAASGFACSAAPPGWTATPRSCVPIAVFLSFRTIGATSLASVSCWVRMRLLPYPRRAGD